MSLRLGVITSLKGSVVAEHEITVVQPARTALNSDYSFEIKSDGRKLGTLHLSKGGADWKPRGSQTAYEVTWEDLARLLDAWVVDRDSVVRAVRRIEKAAGA